MKRREFLKKGSVLIPVVLGGLATSSPIKLFGKSSNNKTVFSLSIITDKPTLTINKIGNAFRFSEFRNLNINFSEHKLIGEQIADIALVKNSSLINFNKFNDKFSTNLKKIANSFTFPKKVTNPTLLVFSAGDNGNPQFFNISVANRLVERMPINSKNGIYKIKGTKDFIELEINKKSARIHSSSCKHKTCLKMGEIKNTGESLVCIPNQVSISVSGNSHKKFDSVTF